MKTVLWLISLVVSAFVAGSCVILFLDPTIPEWILIPLAAVFLVMIVFIARLAIIFLRKFLVREGQFNN